MVDMTFNDSQTYEKMLPQSDREAQNAAYRNAMPGGMQAPATGMGTMGARQMYWPEQEPMYRPEQYPTVYHNQGSTTPTNYYAGNTVSPAYRNSWKEMLQQNIGREVIVSFLVGSQDTVVAQGTLFEVGNDYISLYHNDRDSYITADFYAIKFVEFLAEQARQMEDRPHYQG